MFLLLNSFHPFSIFLSLSVWNMSSSYGKNFHFHLSTKVRWQSTRKGKLSKGKRLLERSLLSRLWTQTHHLTSCVASAFSFNLQSLSLPSPTTLSFSLHLPRFLTLCSPAQTLTAAVSSLCQGLEHVSVLLRDTKFDNNLEAVQLALRCSSPRKGVCGSQRVLERFSRGSWKIFTSLTTCGGTVCWTDFYNTAVVQAAVVQKQKC